VATYYVRTPANGGSDANAGTSTSTAWATFTKAFSASGFTSGDTVYVEPGVYRETVTALNTSPTTRAYVIGDYNGAIFGTVGEVRLTSFTTSDDAAGSASTLLNMNTRKNITLRGIRFEGVGRCIDVNSGATFIDVEDCVIVSQASGAIAFTSASSTALNCNLRRCIIFGISDAVLITPNLAGTSITLNMAIENCMITATTNRGINFSVSGGTTTVATGCTVNDCTIHAPTGIQASASRYTSGIAVLNTLFYLCSTGISAGSTGQVTENYCRYALVSTPTSSITTNGVNSNLVGNLNIDMGMSFLYDYTPRMPWYMPYVANIINGDGTATGTPTDDIHGTTRPSPPSIGASEQTTLYSLGGLMLHPGMTGGMRG
jgi:hypothetical protein